MPDYFKRSVQHLHILELYLVSTITSKEIVKIEQQVFKKTKQVNCACKKINNTV